MTSQRMYDLKETESPFELSIDGRPVLAADHETVLAVLLANGYRAICKTDRGEIYGAFCGMGVCHCCSVRIDGVSRQRSCQIQASPGMNVETLGDPLLGTSPSSSTLEP